MAPPLRTDSRPGPGAGGPLEVLYESRTTRILRGAAGAGVVFKEPLGQDVEARLRHEKDIVARLAGIDGVVQAAEGASREGAIALQDCGALTLAQAAQEGRCGLAMLIELAPRLAAILARIHRAGVIHRDLNPANIMLRESGQPVVIDFDLAVTVDEQPAVAQDGCIVGTLAYLAPEQTGRTGRVVDQRCDLYALGVTLYELATGTLPFDATDTLRLIHDHLVREPAAPAQVDPMVPRGLSDIIVRLLAKEPERRYQSAEGLLHDLRRLRGELDAGQSGTFELGERDFPAILAPPRQLVGRERELAALRAALADARQTSSRTLLVEGSPGVGKSALIGELRPIVAEAGGLFVHGKFDQYQKDRSAEGPLTQALRTLGRLLLAQPAEALASQRQRILDALSLRAGLVTRWLPEFQLLLGSQPEAPEVDPSQAGMQLQQSVVDLVRSIASPARPLVFLIDDLQWAGTAVLRVFARLMNEPGIRGLLLVGAYRVEDDDGQLTPLLAQWRELPVPPVSIVLDNLDEDGTRDLLAHMLRLAPARAQELAAAIQSLAAGNPFDTVETVNALRREGVLRLRDQGWLWDADDVRRFVGSGNVLDLLAARIARIPAPSREVLELMSCLGNAVPHRLLRKAVGLDEAQLDERLCVPLDEGLVVAGIVEGDEGLHFRHDRVQQALLAGMDEARRAQCQLAMARRLVSDAAFEGEAAQLFIGCVDRFEEAEREQAAHLFHRFAQKLVATGRYFLAERYLASAGSLLERADGTIADAPLRAAIDVMLHSTAYSLGRLDAADPVYAAIQARTEDPVEMVEPTCLQMRSLDMRGRAGEAMALGLGLLGRLGVDVPPGFEAADLQARVDGLREWIARERNESPGGRGGIRDRRLLAIARLLGRMARPAFFSTDSRAFVWLMLESQRLWAEYGPCPDLVASMGRLSGVAIGLRQDFRCAYDVTRRVMEVGEALGWEPHASEARGMFAGTGSHWFEPLETTLRQSVRAYEGMQAAGDLSHACYVHRGVVFALLDVAPTIAAIDAEVEAGLALCHRTGNVHAAGLHQLERQLLRALRGRTKAGGFDDDEFDERDFLERFGRFPQMTITHAARRALHAMLMGDGQALAVHADRAMALQSTVPGYYSAAHIHLAVALARAWEVRAGACADPSPLLADIEACRDWLARRAADQPHNFLHLLRLVEAEQAWSQGDLWKAAEAFDAAVLEAEGRRRPWHRALVMERAGLFHLSRGLARTGGELLARARDHYEAWGATAKVARMEAQHALAAREPARPAAPPPVAISGGKGSSSITTEALDLMGVLRASQALSSETSLERLAAKGTEVLAALTGATKVDVLACGEDGQWWLFSPEPDRTSITVAQAAQRGLLAQSAFAYVERTGEVLAVDDAAADDRFAHDPYFADVPFCSLLALPISSQGTARAMLLLENRKGRAAFSGRRLDAVTLIAGQLAVSLANAQLYRSLEERVQARTQELQQAQTELVATARRAGKAEIASNVLHNVGNVLNSVTVSAGVIRATLRDSRLESLKRTSAMLASHAEDLPAFLAEGGRAPALLKYLGEVVDALDKEHQDALSDLDRLARSIDHIAYVVATQQSHAGPSSVLEVAQPEQLVEEALRMSAGAIDRYAVIVERRYEALPATALDKPRMLQILVNLIGNAAQAMESTPQPSRQLTLGTALARVDGASRLRITVKDAGEGIREADLKQLFAHGFTTRKDGHGFGLHSSALAAMEMGGTLTAHSDGPGQGAAFTLELPM